ncbi:hypothetical protein SAMN05421788_104225 [Filimonas lacunae]|uniref:Uncharacterized protein n=1 Tax=Filimonas lacunae TaxID=477680 RepID=A0A1N7PZZ3_9BACT|nr:hypothetical protein SAMN05421788_104225 [Filimonas lacunae]
MDSSYYNLEKRAFRTDKLSYGFCLIEDVNSTSGDNKKGKGSKYAAFSSYVGKTE